MRIVSDRNPLRCKRGVSLIEMLVLVIFQFNIVNKLHSTVSDPHRDLQPPDPY